MSTGPKLAPYTSPEGCLKRADELYKQENKWEDALAVLHVGLQNRRTKQNMAILEKLMVLMIDICVDKLTLQFLKEDIGHFRNLCQHQSTNLLEKVLTYLRNKSEKVFLELEKEKGQEKLMEFLSDDPSELNAANINEQDASADDLIILAYTGLDYFQEKQDLQPKAFFFLDICKNILDTLRSNSKLLPFYNDTARKMFAFCKKYKCKREYRRVSETLHSHFNQIIKMDKLPEQNSKIPHPIKLDEDDQLTQVLKLRKEQLELALFVEEWTDAHRISHSIFQLMSKVSKKKTEKEIKEIYSEFFDHLSCIFWESQLYLFQTYAQMNCQYLAKSLKQPYQVQRQINDKFVLSALSIPLHNRIAQFERMQFNYVPASMKEFDETNLMVREELLATAKMLQVQGYPSRQSLIHYINIENIRANTTEYIATLFELIENEQSPFVIAKKGQVALDSISKNESFKKYKTFIQKTLSVRILQKCKTFYKTMKLSKLVKMLPFCGSISEVEILLQECNREELVYTVINYHSHGEGCLTFNPEAKVAENLFNFGHQLNAVFEQIVDATSERKQNRKRIFEKVKEKLDEEVQEKQKQRQEMIEAQEQVRVQKEQQAELRKELAVKEAARKERELKEQAERDDQRRGRNIIQAKLQEQQKIKAQEVVRVLQAKGFKKVAKQSLKGLEAEPERIDYDEVIDFYQNVLKKEREQIEDDKKKKLREVEIWTRAVREEEKIAIEKYAKTHGDAEMEQIKESIKEKQEAEIKQREALSSASEVFKSHMISSLSKRNDEWTVKKAAFTNTQMLELKQQILDHATSEWRKDYNKELIEKRKREQALRDMEIRKKEMQANLDKGGDGKIDEEGREHGETGWGKGGMNKPDGAFGSPNKVRDGPPRDGGGFNITRSDKPRNTVVEENKGESGRPTFTRGPRKEQDAPDTGFVRGNFTKKTEVDSPKKVERAERPARAAPKDSGDSGAGFGFRSTNTAKKTTKK